MVDIDLSSFGLPWEDFLRDSRTTCARKAPSSVMLTIPANRVRFAPACLPGRIFFKPISFRQRYEQQARDNLAKYFDQLSASP